GVVASYLFAQHRPSQTIPTPQPTPATPSVRIHEPVNVLGGQNYGSLPPFVDTSTRETVTFKGNSTELNIQGASVYLNGEKVDKGDFINVNGQQVRKIVEVGGQGSDFSFSPDHKYFGWRTQFNSGCAGACQDFYLYVINLEQGLIAQFRP